MATNLEGFPEDAATAELSDSSASVVVDETVYPLGAIYGAAYVFIDRCYVLLDRPTQGTVRVTLTSKRPTEATEDSLRALLGEFANELLGCAWRQQIGEANRGLIESVTMAAISGAAGPPSLDELEEFDFTDEPFEDPLGIAMSWEEKYAKKKDPPGES